MQCRNHTDVAAVDRCAGCAEPFCFNCLADVSGQKYCQSCKIMAVPGGQAPVLEEPAETCRGAKLAMIFGIFGYACLGSGLVLAPVAMVMGLLARREIAEDPSLGGEGMANAAIVLGALGLLISIAFAIAQLSLGAA